MQVNIQLNTYYTKNASIGVERNHHMPIYNYIYIGTNIIIWVCVYRSMSLLEMLLIPTIKFISYFVKNIKYVKTLKFIIILSHYTHKHTHEHMQHIYTQLKMASMLYNIGSCYS